MAVLELYHNLPMMLLIISYREDYGSQGPRKTTQHGGHTAN